MIRHRLERALVLGGFAAVVLVGAVASAAPLPAPIPGTIDTIAGGGVLEADGVPATDASLTFMMGLAVNHAGDVFVSDAGTCAIRKISQGIITRVVGTGTCTYSGSSDIGDGGPALAATLQRPQGLAFDSDDNLYIADSFNCEVRKVDAQTNTISAFAGMGPWFCGGGPLDVNGIPATEARLTMPVGIAIDRFDNVYFSELAECHVRKVTNGIINVFAGQVGACGFSGDDGPAVAAQLRAPASLAIDSDGVLYIGDDSRVRAVRAGVITTIAGANGVGYPDGPAMETSLTWMQGMAADAAGGLLIADSDNCVVRRLKDGMITTVAGAPLIMFDLFVPVCGHTGDGGPATSAEIGQPVGVAVDGAGNVYFAEIHQDDSGPASVRVVYGVVPPPAPAVVRSATPTAGRTAAPSSTPAPPTATAPPATMMPRSPQPPSAEPAGDRAGAITGPDTGTGASGGDAGRSPLLAGLAAAMLLAGLCASALGVRHR